MRFKEFWGVLEKIRAIGCFLNNRIENQYPRLDVNRNLRML